MKDDVVVITGGLGQLGRAAAEAARARGARTALVDFASEPAQPPEADLHLYGVDLTDPAAAERAMKAVRERLGRLDVLLNIAGGFSWETLDGGDPRTWEKMFALNLKTAVNATRAALPHLLAGGAGRVVNVGAAGAVKAAAGMGPYAASKAGVMRFTEALAEELKTKDVTVNAVLPSIIDTPQNRADMPEADPGKWVTAADLAAVMLFLGSREARAVTGALLPVTGRV
ncbi:MAG: SDR family NAD(P)-dependent oxidoreductase [Pseudomonadota bacterium]|nr:SDR family NAD(P)-dependent oxidoreductase [Pseudomonadota bacterium]